MFASQLERLRKMLPRRTNQIILSSPGVRRRAWYDKLLFTPTELTQFTDLVAYKYSFSYQFDILWAKTYIPADDYTPPSDNHPAGLLYGKPVSSQLLVPEITNDEALRDEEEEPDNACDNPYSIKGKIKSFFGFPYNEENGISGVRFAGFLFKLLVLQKWLLNTFKLFTEITPGSAVAGSNTLIFKAKDNYRGTESTAKRIGWMAVLTVGRLLFGLSSLAYFTGRAITSPMENLGDVWDAFATMRAKKAWYWKALGVGLGAMGCLLSIAVTGAAYTLLSPIAVAVGTFVLGAVGLGATGIAIGLAAVEVAKFLGPVASAATAVIGPSLTHLFGLACGLLTPTVIAPVAHAIDVIGSKVLNTVADLGKRFVQWCKKDNSENQTISIIQESEQEDFQDENKKDLSQNAQMFQKLHDPNHPAFQQKVVKTQIMAQKPVPQVNESPKRKALQNDKSSKKKKDRGCNFLGCFAMLFRRSKKTENLPGKSTKTENRGNIPKPLEGPVYSGL